MILRAGQSLLPVGCLLLIPASAIDVSPIAENLICCLH